MEMIRSNQGVAQSLSSGTGNKVEESVNIKVNTPEEHNVVEGSGVKDPTDQELKKAVEKINKFFEDDHIKAEYSHHEKLKDLMIKIVNTETKEVILEIPPKKILDMVAKMCEMAGLIVDKKA